jgi:HlyD family secretion protein
MNAIGFTTQTLVVLACAGLMACNGANGKADGYGNFEATEVIISAEANGRIMTLSIREGERLQAGDTVGRIDCQSLALQRAQAEANLQALDDQTIDYKPESEVYTSRLTAETKRLEALYEQRRVMEVEQRRIRNLVEDDAAPTMQLDDINGKVAVLEREIAAAESGLDVIRQQITSLRQSTSDKNQGILSAQSPLRKQVDLIEEQLSKCVITNPVNGTVLDVYSEEHEFVSTGKPLYKIADLSVMQLRVYIGARQLPAIESGQTVEVGIDQEEGMKTYTGRIAWIASEAEFTPKVIQTKEERVNLVYAVVVEVENDGALKIGMPAEVWLTKQTTNEGE